MPGRASRWTTIVLLPAAARSPQLLARFAALTVVFAWPLVAQAQSYPNRPIVMVVPFAAGGTFDVMGRIMAVRMSELLGQQVIVENTTGAAA